MYTRKNLDITTDYNRRSTVTTRNFFIFCFFDQSRCSRVVTVVDNNTITMEKIKYFFLFNFKGFYIAKCFDMCWNVTDSRNNKCINTQPVLKGNNISWLVSIYFQNKYIRVR